MNRVLPILIGIAVAGGLAWFAFQKKPAPTGASLYRDRGCAVCHGAKGEGTDHAPALSMASGRVPRERLEEYLKSPTRVLPQSKMPSVPLTDEEVRMLAEYVDTIRKP